MTSKVFPLNRFTVYWCDSIMGIHIDNHQGEWNGCRLQSIEVVPAAKFDAVMAVVEAVRKDIAKYQEDYPNGVRFALTEIALQHLG